MGIIHSPTLREPIVIDDELVFSPALDHYTKIQEALLVALKPVCPIGPRNVPVQLPIYQIRSHAQNLQFSTARLIEE